VPVGANGTEVVLLIFITQALVAAVCEPAIEIAEELEKQSQGRGLVPSEMKDYINSLFEITEPVIDWVSYLRRFNSMSTIIHTEKTRRKPNRRFGSGPALKIKQKKKTLVAIDTSGSVSKKDLIELFNEIYHIYKTGTYIDIVECDAKIQRVYQYKGEREEIEVKGRDGTSFEPIMKYLAENHHPHTSVYVTSRETALSEFQLCLSTDEYLVD